ncbi:MAG: hypothetical protein MUC66_08630 [Methanolinea sp.]|jgi:hypothetical protein|nr:hypothetical protein [Methanolinea sp.]
MKMPGLFHVMALFLAIGILCSGCITPPKEQLPETSSPGVGQGTAVPTPSPTQQIMDTRYVTQATPFPTGTPTTTRPTYSSQPNFTVEPTVYKVIYLNTIDFKYSVSAYDTTVANPPLIIEICLIPKMVTRNIWYESRYTTKEDVYTTQTYVSPASYFEIRVRDKGSGEIVEKDGFGKTYSVDTKKVIQVRTSGEYLIEFSGNDIVATVQMRVPAPLDGVVTPAGTLACPS